MTDPELTPDERRYYADKLAESVTLVTDMGMTDNTLIAAVFERIASPLHFLRHAQPQAPAMTDVTPEAVHGGEATQFQRAKDGRDYVREDHVKADVMAVLQHLRVHAKEARYGWDRPDGYTYTLSRYQDKDYLWRKPAPKEASP